MLTALLVIFMSAARVQGLPWSEPTSAPPDASKKAFLNIGPLYQEKSALPGPTYFGPANDDGSIGANDFRMEAFGKWASELGGLGGCNWSGWKCDCRFNGGTPAERVIVGVECTANTISNFKFFNFNISTGGGSLCPDSVAGAPAYLGLSQCSIYTYTN